eukprot:gene5385-10772_t
MIISLRLLRVQGFSTLTPAVKVPSGLVCIYKPKDWSSNDVVVHIRNILQNGARESTGRKGIKIKAGHGGTLDPLAEGVLVMGIGEGTKLMGEYLAGSKGYRTIALLGTEYDTLDCTGTIIETKDCSHVTIESLENALTKFRGDILQIPPMYSALKRDGKKLYDLAREGITVEREARPVTVYSLELAHPKSLPYFGLNIESSGGFYVRSLISDLARECDGIAHMTALIRTKQGPYEIDDCLKQSDWNFNKIIEKIHICSEKAELPDNVSPEHYLAKSDINERTY